MTNSPTFDQQLAINTYWKGVNGLNFQPGTIGSADRFVRMSWSLNAAPKEATRACRRSRLFVDPFDLGSARARRPRRSRTSLRRSGGQCPTPGPSATFLSSSYTPSIFWVEFTTLKLEDGSAPAKLDLERPPHSLRRSFGQVGPHPAVQVPVSLGRRARSPSRPCRSRTPPRAGSEVKQLSGCSTAERPP